MSSHPPTSLDPNLRVAPVAGRNLAPGPLEAQWATSPTLLLFLRHFG